MHSLHAQVTCDEHGVDPVGSYQVSLSAQKIFLDGAGSLRRCPPAAAGRRSFPNLLAFLIAGGQRLAAGADKCVLQRGQRRCACAAFPSTFRRTAMPTCAPVACILICILRTSCHIVLAACAGRYVPRAVLMDLVWLPVFEWQLLPDRSVKHRMHSRASRLPFDNDWARQAEVLTNIWTCLTMRRSQAPWTACARGPLDRSSGLTTSSSGRHAFNHPAHHAQRVLPRE